MNSPESRPPDVPATSSLRDHEILVVDDDAGIRSLLASAFERRGIDTNVAETGREALELLRRRSERYCAVLLDLRVPPPNGIEIAKFIRDHDPTLPVIVISGHADLAERVAAEDLGGVVKKVLMKPVDIVQVMDFVHGAGYIRMRTG